MIFKGAISVICLPTSVALLHAARTSARKEHPSMSFFYEIRGADNTVLKRDGGFASQDAAKMAAREDAKKMKAAPKSDRPDVGRILVGQNAEKPTRH
jgi:hypothetical protein